MDFPELAITCEFLNFCYCNFGLFWEEQLTDVLEVACRLTTSSTVTHSNFLLIKDKGFGWFIIRSSQCVNNSSQLSEL
jgi:hypothetical protein